MKILEKRYPLGSFKGQQTPGRYIDGTLKENVDLLAKNIVKDMTYLGIIASSTLEVGTGKSVFAQQLGEAYLEAVRKYHKINSRLTMNNIVFRPKDIIERSFKVERYSVVICDEWEDANYWSELGITLRQFFRKCRQLNLFILIIIPNFFQLPMSYAVSRSVFFIDVRFSGEFDRGYFSFYNFSKKKKLYLKGKRHQDYNVTKPNFLGRFADGYSVGEKEYRDGKLKDLLAQENLEKKPEVTEREIRKEMVGKLYNNMPKVSQKELSEWLEVSDRTIWKWLKEIKESQNAEFERPNTNVNNLIESPPIPSPTNKGRADNI